MSGSKNQPKGGAPKGGAAKGGSRGAGPPLKGNLSLKKYKEK